MAQNRIEQVRRHLEPNRTVAYELPDSPILRAIAAYPNRPSITAGGREYSYARLMRDSMRLRDTVWRKHAEVNGLTPTSGAEGLRFADNDLKERRVALLFPPGYENVVAFVAAMAAGGAVVPLSPSYPQAELSYFISDSEPSVFIIHTSLVSKLSPILEQIKRQELLPDAQGKVAVIEVGDSPKTEGDEFDVVPRFVELDEGRDALFIYTSGTTGRPKGAVRDWRTLYTMSMCMSSLFETTPDDKLLHVLPLHHANGIVVCLLGPLSHSAQVEFMHPFTAESVWNRIVSGNPLQGGRRDVTIFAAVPTIVARLIRFHEEMAEAKKDEATRAWKNVRVVTSGSAAVPDNQFNAFKRVTGHELVERYGSTELGVCLTNPFRGARIPGSAGLPIPGIQIRLWDHGTNQAVPETAVDVPGEIQVKTTALFKYYWKRPEATAEFLREDGWVRTGDVAARMENGYYRILGRESTDIIKTGGYKVSALECEREVLDYPLVESCAVFGLPDDEYGERVALAIVPKDDLSRAAQSGDLTLKKLRVFLKERLAGYKVPTRLLLLNESDMPRTALGKVQKRDLRDIFKRRMEQVDTEM
ncbi:acetyl-CoA synthetase-like protein [Gonapodya prolifera JEL478]|uniref:Acetyl-CoA synthetase-like protein n=1 Tax=Gonapodya prolifera (strain JEL478) TaxID=1344416 RepID=A0A138ZWX2_GONPJ|nr:acetyl-CoA synthetase-like protein [Gonapodya prolifera JEL478]|eukprot:KXS09010.1 acetyl-CoA synthetase-like protein [Gonapodya prolifera JEL478]